MMEIARGPSTNQMSVDSSSDQPKGRPSVDIVGILSEVSHVCHQLEPSVPAEWMLKRVQFLAYELQTYFEAAADAGSESGRLKALNRFFFEEKKFRCIDTANSPIDGLRLNRVLSSRLGVPMMLELIYAYLAEGIGLALEFVDLKPICFLKWRDGLQTHYIDLSRNGKTLTSDELIETLNSRLSSNSVASAQVLEALSSANFTTEYLLALKKALGNSADPQTLLYLQDTLVRLQPNNFQLIGDRALLHRRLGNLKSALADLKRYFAFHDKSRSSNELIKLHNDLIQHFEGR